MSFLRGIFSKHPITRGMVVYAILWPSSDLCRQLAANHLKPDGESKAPLDYKRMIRFSLFGTIWVAPAVYTWIKISSLLIPGSTLGVAVLKAIVEQFTYGPFSIVTFYTGMSLLEGHSLDYAWKEVQSKFLPTYKTGITFWPLVQTFNFSIVPERNRVAFVGLASFIWTAYLSLMKARPVKNGD